MNQAHMQQALEDQEKQAKELRAIIAAQAARIEMLEEQMTRTANVEEMTAIVAAAVGE